MILCSYSRNLNGLSLLYIAIFAVLFACSIVDGIYLMGSLAFTNLLFIVVEGVCTDFILNRL